MGLFLPESGTVFWMVFIFGIVLIILKKFAWKPILNALNEREASIEKAMKAAEIARKEIANVNADKKAIKAEAQREKERILKEAAQIRDNILAEAREKGEAERSKIVEQGMAQIRLEKTAALNDIKKQVVNISVEIAEKIIREKIKPTSEQEKIIDGMLQDFNMN
ncbi:MAG: F0F1 ATP synthase subunit B [Prolixibacteraceae bacterium]|nr:F0F1 ATP synthase subunit B [Prolixibacteraceae bacterium]